MSPLFSYYGDDFTGSTDALEALAMNGVRTVLFPCVPSPERLDEFASYQAFGVAGESRSRNPEWMRNNLPAVFGFLCSLGAPVVQYKVCSTFDSSPETGNIAVAGSIGRKVFGAAWTPVVVAAHRLHRYVLFGNLFATQGDKTWRIDRHPTMSRHPVTPMLESDLRLHLSRQAPDKAELVDILSLIGSDPSAALEEILEENPAIVVFDGLDERTETATGRLLWERRAQYRFAIGSSGLTHALVSYWRKINLIAQDFSPPAAAPAERLIVVSGSCSPVTEEQIEVAAGHGFDKYHLADFGRDELVRLSLDSLSRGKSLIIYSALGARERRGSLRGEELGSWLGELLRDLILRSGVRRAIIAGGDTSSHAVSRLRIDALTFAAPLAPGVPLCRVHSAEASMEGVELALKGGQVGGRDFFEKVLKGY
jgi:3-oxoisoapionate kinase